MAEAKGGTLVRVLIVDDDPDQRMLLRRVLTRAGVQEVIEAVDGSEALAVATDSQPDLVVLDLAMPVRTGLDVLPELQDELGAVPIVVLSAFPRERVADIAIARGAIGYVEKGVPSDQLVAQILLAAAITEDAIGWTSVRLPSDATSARRARELLRELLGHADRELLSSIELLVSELVSNAVEHADSAPRIGVHLNAERVRVEVHDDRPELPERRHPRPDEVGGRGLGLVDALSSRWGAHPEVGGKVVWFEVDRAGTAPEP